MQSLKQELINSLSPYQDLQRQEQTENSLNFEVKKVHAFSFDEDENCCKNQQQLRINSNGSNDFASTAEMSKLSHSGDHAYEPIVGVLTMPVSEEKKELFSGKDEYILQINDQFHTFSQDSRTVAIRYNLEED